MKQVMISPPRELATQFEVLKHKIMYSLNGKLARPVVVAFTSYFAGEGVTGVAVNFASTLAEEGDCSVLLMDGNLKAPSLHNVIGPCQPKGGSRDLINEKKELVLPAWTLLQVNDRLDVLFSQHPVDQSERIFGNKNFDNFISRLQEHYAFLIIDGTPLSEDAGSIMLAARADAVVLVIEAERTRREVIRHAVTMLERTGANIIGVVLNKQQYPQQVFTQPGAR